MAKTRAGKIINKESGSPEIYRQDTIKCHICCDCGLTHLILVDKVKKKKVITYWYRDEYETKRERKRKRKKEGK